MPYFNYTAKDATSKKVHGQAEADSPSDLSHRLRSQNLYMTDCRQMVSKDDEKYKLKPMELVE
ncbi:MAG: type II secretion system F family protein, partial [Oscillospiraceae bacterium]